MNKKNIVINDKKTFSKLKKKNNKREILKTKKFNFIDEDLFESREKQKNLLEKIKEQMDFREKKTIETELLKKIQSYKSQDREKSKYILNEDKIINLYSVIDLLLDANLKCYYCKCDVFILYKNVRQNNQWTLDRLNNNLGHNYDNCVISCLKCNLQRRMIDDDKFLFTKQMNIKKLEENSDLNCDCREKQNDVERKEINNEKQIKNIKKEKMVFITKQ